MADSQVLKALLPDNPLCGIDTNKDTLNLATGACTRQIKKVVFDGTEEWNYEVTAGTYHNFYTAIQYSDGEASTMVVCSHQVSISAGGGYAENCWLSTTRRFNICIQRFGKSITEFKAWLAAQYAAGTPVTFWYRLSSSTTETIPVPSGLTGTMEGYLNQDGTPTPTNPIYPTANNVEIWQHSLRKLTTATEAVENPLYSDGTAITAYTIKGNTVQSGTPTPSAPLPVNGVGNKTANLFNKQAVTNNERVVYTDGTTAPLTGVDVSDYIPLETGETYTLNISSSIVTKTGHLYAMYDNSKNFVDTGQHPSTGAIIYTFTVPNGVSYIRFNSLMTELDNVMLVKGSYTTQTFPPYEPYGYKIPISSGGVTTNIYLSEPLYKIADTADTINSDGTVTRRIGKIDLGSLSWSIGSSGNITTTENVPNLHIINNAGKDNAFCTILSETYPNYVASTNYSFSSCLNSQPRPFINKTGFEGLTADQFKEAVKGEYMYYILATPTTEQITLPSIPTTEGANTITVDTTVQPSEFTATWTGWHDSSVKEYDGSDWQ